MTSVPSSVCFKNGLALGTSSLEGEQSLALAGTGVGDTPVAPGSLILLLTLELVTGEARSPGA